MEIFWRSGFCLSVQPTRWRVMKASYLGIYSWNTSGFDGPFWEILTPPPPTLPTLDTRLSGTQSPCMGSIWIISNWECDSFLLIAENCCCIWLWKIQFCCSGWMLKRKNRGRDRTDNSKNGRWNYTLYMSGISNLIITEHAVHVL